MDLIFTELGHEEGEYPFEHSWRRDGCTSNMILRFAERNKLKCYVHHKGGKIETHVPANNLHAATIQYCVFGSHAYWYAKDASTRGADRRTSACNAASQQSTAAPAAICDSFSDKEIGKVFGRLPAPPYKDWCDMRVLIDNLKYNQDAYRDIGAKQT